jgi:carboxypeptidase PM20D1
MGVRNLFFPNQTVYAVSVAEKGTLWARLVARGEAGHGSTPVPGRAPERLMAAIRLLEAQAVTPQIQPSMYELLRRVGAARGGMNGFVLQRPFLVDALVTSRLMRQPATRAVISHTCQVTGFEGKGSNANVIPSEVAAILDCRLLPGTSPEEMREKLETLLKTIPQVHLEVLAKRQGNESPTDNAFFDALVRQIQRGRKDVVAGPVVSPGFTDSIYLRPTGARAYGIVPFELTLEELQGFHGRNERVSVENVHRGLEILFRAIVDVSASGKRE